MWRIIEYNSMAHYVARCYRGYASSLCAIKRAIATAAAAFAFPVMWRSFGMEMGS